jgi:hypothetical protein
MHGLQLIFAKKRQPNRGSIYNPHHPAGRPVLWLLSCGSNPAKAAQIDGNQGAGGAIIFRRLTANCVEPFFPAIDPIIGESSCQ